LRFQETRKLGFLVKKLDGNKINPVPSLLQSKAGLKNGLMLAKRGGIK